MNNSLRLAVIALSLAVSSLSAATLYVPTGGSIQAAVSSAMAGDEIVVSNGIYATGTTLVGGYTLPNRVAVTKPLTVRSVNGPQVTVIAGYQDPTSRNTTRCVYLASGASLSGFTLTSGGAYTGSSDEPDGS